MTKKDFALLGVIIAAMAVAEKPYHMATAAEIKGLAKAELVQTNEEIKDGDKVAVRATDKGIAEHAAQVAKGDTAATPRTAPELTIGSGFVVPAGVGAKKTELYPFDTLAVGGFIFVPTSEDKPNPAKSLASTVSAATKRYAVEVPGQTRTDRNGKVVPMTNNTRVFTVVPVKSGVAYGEFTAPSDGAAIVRLADNTPTPAPAAEGGATA